MLFNKLRDWMSIPRVRVITACCLLILLGILLFSLATSDKSAKNIQKNIIEVPKYSYTFQSTTVSCKDILPYPGAEQTTHTCGGKLLVLDTTTSKSKSFNVGETSHLYQNGKELPIINIHKLTPNKTKLAISFFDKTNSLVKNIIYIK